MTKKAKTYSLLLVVLIIWGILGYKVFAALLPDSPPKQMAISKGEFKFNEDFSRDTFSIAANYRDPFLSTPYRPKQVKQTIATPKKQVKNIPAKKVHFAGSVMDKNAGSRIFFVNIDGEQHIMEIGSVAQEIFLVKGNDQQITIRENGKTRVVVLSQ